MIAPKMCLNQSLLTCIWKSNFVHQLYTLAHFNDQFDAHQMLMFAELDDFVMFALWKIVWINLIIFKDPFLRFKI